jgi:hypothetical protein
VTPDEKKLLLAIADALLELRGYMSIDAGRTLDAARKSCSAA